MEVDEPDGKVIQYTYDKAGNRLTESITSGEAISLATYHYDERNRLLTIDQNGKEITTYSYDNNGNMLTYVQESLQPVGEGGAETETSVFVIGQTSEQSAAVYEYDLFNQMTKSYSGDKIVENKYNGEGLRVEKTVSGDITRYLYEQDNVILEVDGSNQQTASNVIGTNLISRTVTDGGTTTKLYYLYNGHGDVTELIDSDGTIQAQYTYDAFGVPKTTTGTIDNPFRYAGYQYDESGLYYLKARMYNPIIARFMQEDTYRGQANDPLSLNLYVYCANNPIIYTDPTGHVYTAWDKANGVDKAKVDAATKAYDAAKKAGNTAGMAAAHADAEAARAGAHKKTGTVGTASGYTYVKQNDGSKKLNAVDSALLKTVRKSGYSTMNGSYYLPVAEIKSTQVVKPSTSTPTPSISVVSASPFTQLSEDAQKLNLVIGYFDAQKNPQEAQRGAKDAVNQLSFVIGGAVTDAGQGAVGYTISGEKLTTSQRGMYVAGAVIPFINGAEIRGGARLAEELIESGSEVVTKPNQLHHFATNKNITYTPQLEEVAKKYDLNLNDSWNKEMLPHQGRHPNEYHEYVLDSMKQFDEIAKGDKDVFLKLYDSLKKNINSNPEMLYKDYWK